MSRNRIVMLAAVVVAIGGAAYFMFGQDSTTQEAATPAPSTAKPISGVPMPGQGAASGQQQ